ncbi:hypothetical protein ACVMYR_28945 [Micromonospora sp. PTRAS2]
MMSVVAGFLLAEDIVIRSLGFALAFSIAVDALLVRMTIVSRLCCRCSAGPRGRCRDGWTDILPNIDVQGSRLAEQLARGEH